MTPLKSKMMDDLRLRNLGSATRKSYLGCIRRFAVYFGASPDTLGTEEVREFLLHLLDRALAPATRVVYHSALSFLYVHTLGRPEVMATIPRPRVKAQRLGTPLTRAEVRVLLSACVSLPFVYTFFATMLATGARLSECRTLRVRDIDRRARLIHIRCGKGGHARSVMLSDKHLRLLERYWTVEGLSGELLFPAQRLLRPCVVDTDNRWTDHCVAKDTMGRHMRAVVKRSGLKRRVTTHDLRRTFATWLLERHDNLRLVQVLLGHASPKTTARYTQIHADIIANTPSPYDQL
jgi:integrase/recombinase XerD